MSQPRGGGDPMGRIVRAVRHPTRRAILDALRGTDTTTVEDLTRAVVATETSQSDGGDDRDEREQLAVVLHHHHLPQLAAAGAISYDPDSGEVETTPHTDVASDLVQSLRERDAG